MFRKNSSRNTVLCRQLPAVLLYSLTGERCGEASAEFSILLPPRRPRVTRLWRFFNPFCICFSLLSAILKTTLLSVCPMPYLMRQAAERFSMGFNYYIKSDCMKQVKGKRGIFSQKKRPARKLCWALFLILNEISRSLCKRMGRRCWIFGRP